MKVDFVWMWAPPTVHSAHQRRRARFPNQVISDFIFNLCIGKPNPVVVCLHPVAGWSRCQLVCWPTVANILGWVGDPTEEEVLLRQCIWADFAVANASQTEAGAAEISWSASAGRCLGCCVQWYGPPHSCCRAVVRACFRCRTCYLDKRGRRYM